MKTTLTLLALSVVLFAGWYQLQHTDVFSEVGRYQIVEVQEEVKEKEYTMGVPVDVLKKVKNTYLLDTKTGILYERDKFIANDVTRKWNKNTENVPPLDKQLAILGAEVNELEEGLKDPSKSHKDRNTMRVKLYKFENNHLLSRQQKRQLEKIRSDDTEQSKKDNEEFRRELSK